MTEEQFDLAMAKLTAAFPQREIKPETLVVYWDMLHSVPWRIFQGAVNRCIAEYEWFPTISQLIRACDEIGASEIADPFEAMMRYPRLVKNPAIRSLLFVNLNDVERDDDRPGRIRAEDGRSFGFLADSRRLGSGKPEA